MEYFEAVNRLANHANILGDETILPEKSIIFNLWLANESRQFPDIESLTSDVLQCLEIVNKIINGASRKELAGQRIIDFRLTFTVSLIVAFIQEYALIWRRDSHFEENEIERLRVASWEISQSWCSILHGDIESIEEEIRLQRLTKGI